MIGTSGGLIRPSWLRPGALAAVAAMHVAAISLVAIHRTDPPGIDETVEITIAQGAPEPEPPKPPEPEPEPPPPPPEPPPEPPKEPPPLEVQPPPPPEPEPPEPPPEPPPAPPKREVISAPALPPPPKPKPPKPKPVEAPPEAAKPPDNSGTPEAPARLAQAKATYAQKVLQEIRNHRIATTGTGVVVVGFTIDAAGNMENVTVVQSSGRREMDFTALRMVRAARPGPPPDGSFSATTRVNFTTD